MDGWLTSQDVCEMAGLSYRALDYWVRVEILRPALNPSGSGRPRRWSDDDAVSACLAAQLRRRGCSLTRIALMLDAWSRDGCPREGLWLVTSRSAHPVPPDPAQLPLVLAQHPEPVTLIDLTLITPAELRRSDQEAA